MPDAPVRPIPARQDRSRRTEARLLAAAAEVFGRLGLPDASISDLCREAGVGVGTFYGRFRDKDAFLGVFFGEYYRRAEAALDRTFGAEAWRGRPTAEIVDAWVAHRVARFREHRALTRAILGYTRARPDAAFTAAAARFSGAVVDRFTSLLAQAADPVRHPPPRRAAVLVVSTVEALLKELALYGERRSPALAIADRELARELSRMMRGYLGVATSPIPEPPDPARSVSGRAESIGARGRAGSTSPRGARRR